MSTVALLSPARNAARTLPRLLASAQQESRFDEIVIFDDASTDGTGDVAMSLGARVIRSEINLGPSEGKNRLAKATSCDWLHFIDADDALAPGAVSRMRRWSLEPGVDVVLFGTEDRDDETGATIGRSERDDSDVRRDPVRYHLTHTVTNCALHQRAAFLEAGGFDTDPVVKYNEDQAMHLRLALAGLRFRGDSATTVIHYRRPGTMSSGHPIECARAQVDVLGRVATRTGRRYRDEIGARLWKLAGVCGSFGDWTYVERCLAIAEAVGYRAPVQEHWMIRAIARFNPGAAIRLRERCIRLMKPHLRAGVPMAPATGGPR